MQWSKRDFPIVHWFIPNALLDKGLEISNTWLSRGEKEVSAFQQYTEDVRTRSQNLFARTAQQTASVTDTAAAEIRRSTRARKADVQPLHDVADKTREAARRLHRDAELVVKHPDGWAVKAADADRATKVFERKAEAIAEARKIAQNKGVALLIENADGQIEEVFEDTAQAVDRIAERTREAIRQTGEKAREANDKVQDMKRDVKDRAEKAEMVIKEQGQYVEPHAEGWAIRVANASRVTQVFATKDEAVEKAKELAQKQEVPLTILKQDGTVQQVLYKEN